MSPDILSRGTYVALSGGVGGAKLSLGLAHQLNERLSVVVNTGDDFEHLGLHISPDVDTTLYTLAGIVNAATGWGRDGETWSFLETLKTLGGPEWFKLGDRDLAIHIERTRRLKRGETLTAISATFAGKLGVRARILPMTDDAIRTLVDTDRETLAFQEYFVRERCKPVVRGIRFAGADVAQPSAQVLQALTDARIAGIVFCPSNPWLSIDPILAMPGLRSALRKAQVPVIAVSPIIAGEAVKGPTAKIMRELGVEASCPSIARHYAGLIDGLIIDRQDAALAAEMKLPVVITNTLMRTLEDKIALAGECLTFCSRLTSRSADAQRAEAPQ
jgi:LPPG:FO 2-phospho-L-lactate transferase